MCINTAILGTDFDYKIHVLSTLKHSCKGLAGLFMNLQKKKILKRHFCTFVHFLFAPVKLFFNAKTISTSGARQQNF